jgi:hypothetical protein
VSTEQATLIEGQVTYIGDSFEGDAETEFQVRGLDDHIVAPLTLVSAFGIGSLVFAVCKPGEDGRLHVLDMLCAQPGLPIPESRKTALLTQYGVSASTG